MKRLASLLLFVCAVASAQQSTTGRIPQENLYTGDPSGVACSNNAKVQSTTTGGIYTCISGHYVGSAGLSGVSADGANGLTVTGKVATTDAVTSKTPAIDVRAYGAKLDGVTDDTTALQNAVNACFAQSGSLYIPSVGGKLHLGGTINGACDALICAPSVAATSPSQQCEIYSNTENNWVGSGGFNPSGVIQTAVSAGTDSNSAIIGVPSHSGNFGNFDNVVLKIRNLSFLTYANPSIGGVNCAAAGECYIDHMTYSDGESYGGTRTQPTNTRTAVILPLVNNWNKATIHNSTIFGIYSGVEISEHADVQNVNIQSGIQGIVTTQGYHTAHLRNVSIAEVVTPIVATGGILPVQIDNLDLEIDPNQVWCTWCYSTTDVSDPSNYLVGVIPHYVSVTAGNGNYNVLHVSGGSSLFYPAGSNGSGGPILTAPVGNQTITEPTNDQFIVHGNATSFSTPFFLLDSTQSCNTFCNGPGVTWSSMTAGGVGLFQFGTVLGANFNSANLGFHYAGSGSSANYGTLGIYSVNSIINWFGTGDVTIGTTTDCGKALCVSGSVDTTAPSIAAGSQTVSGCTLSSATGGSWAGKFASGTTGTCTVTITPGITAPNGLGCIGSDTATHVALTQSGLSATTCIITGSTTSGDAVTWQVWAF